MDYNKLKFDWKAIAAIALMLGMWYDLKTDFSVFKATTEIRINALESLLAQNTYRAIMPKETKIENANNR